MRRWGRYGFGAPLFALALAGCPPQRHEPSDGGASTSACARDATGSHATTFTFVVTTLEIDPTDSLEEPHTGFDVDGFVSSEIDPMGCTHPDFLSALDPDLNCSRAADELCAIAPVVCSARNVQCTVGTACLGAVDNQLPTLANTIQTVSTLDGRATLRDAISQSRDVIIIQVADVDDLQNDDRVTARLAHGFTTARAPCVAVDPTALFQFDRRSLDAETGALAAVELPGEIVNGRVQARGVDSAPFTVAWPLGAIALQLETRRPIIRFDIARDGLRNGNYGGWISADRIAEWGHASVPPDLDPYVLGVIGGLVDIQIAGVCDGSQFSPPRGLGGVSIGLGFTAAAVRIDPNDPVVEAPVAGSCSDPTTARGDDAGLGSDATDGASDAASDS